MLKAELDMAVQRGPLGFMSALYGELLNQGRCSVPGFFCFSQAEWERELGLGAPTVLYWLLRLTVSFLEGVKLHLLGELSFYQQERNTTLLAKHLTSSQSGEQREVDECRGKTCPHCYARRIILGTFFFPFEFWWIQAVI